MSTESIQTALRERFAAPLQEFYKRRIIFWQDEDREFEKMVDEISVPGVTIIKLTGNNNFAVKKLLLHDDLTGDYLIYNPISYEKPQDNWLRDIELWSEEYRADYLSMLMRELHVEPTAAMRKTMKVYARFVESKELRKKLRRVGRDYLQPLPLHTDIMAVLCGLNGGNAQDVIIAVLAAGLDEDSNDALNKIKKYGNVDAFWQLVRKYTGYIHEDGDPLGFFAAHVLLTAASQTMNHSLFKGLDRFISDTNKAYCYSIVHEWRHRDDNEVLYDLCRTVEQEMQLVNRLDKQEIETLLTGDIFPAIHESILKKFYGEIGEQIVRTDMILKATENRRTSGWFAHFVHYYDCLYYIAKMQQFYQIHSGNFHIVDPQKVWKLYADTAWEMDSYYRHFHQAFAMSLQDSNAVLDDALKKTLDYVEGLYQNWFLQTVNTCWANAIEDDLAKIGYVSEIDRQRDFYAKYVRPVTKKSRAFVIISDALRYEVAVELNERLIRETKGTSKLDAVQAMFPTITKVGMAALLPGFNMSMDSNIDVLLNGQHTRSTAERQKVLCNANPNSVAIQATDLLNMTKEDRKSLLGGKEVIYIYHNTIDAIGDKAPTEKKVCEACADAIDEIMSLVKTVIGGDIRGTDIVITADHGFLYTYSPLRENDKIDKSVFEGKVYELGRRYAIAESCTVDYMMPVRLQEQLHSAEAMGFAPQETIRIKVPGGGQNYVHGGISVQEMAVPVITFKNLRANNKNYVELKDAELILLSENRKISNLLFSLDFFQQQPVGEKIQPCAYTIYMTDDAGAVVSDRQTIIADRTSINAAERVFRVRFNLKAGSYNRKKIYRLVIARERDIPIEVEFTIDIAFADDFGFDL
ncbi:MAG: BREX-1 system phosphatase PglZ type A [Ruminococcaceae bacterium]|nr:BREX-1 system phosphatase PglZ type A [Oscillospiraceae bacterium]